MIRRVTLKELIKRLDKSAIDLANEAARILRRQERKELRDLGVSEEDISAQRPLIEAAGERLRVAELARWQHTRASIVQALLDGSWWPRRPTWIWIPKKGGKARQVQSWAFPDKVVSRSLAALLAPAVKELSESFARRGQGQQAAFGVVAGLIRSGESSAEVWDIVQFFDQIPRGKVFAYLGRILERPVLRVVQRLCSAGGGKGTRGIGQGAPHCPAVADLFISPADSSKAIRYMDEVYISARSPSALERLATEYQNRLRRLGLSAKRAADNEVNAFLGAYLCADDRGRLVARRSPSRKGGEGYLQSVQEHLDRSTSERRVTPA